MEYIKVLKNEENIIKDCYNFYVETYHKKPQLAVCEIEWKEDSQREEVLIGLGVAEGDALDDSTTFNCTDINDFIHLCNSDSEDFKVMKFKEFKGDN